MAGWPGDQGGVAPRVCGGGRGWLVHAGVAAASGTGGGVHTGCWSGGGGAGAHAGGAAGGVAGAAQAGTSVAGGATGAAQAGTSGAGVGELGSDGATGAAHAGGAGGEAGGAQAGTSVAGGVGAAAAGAQAGASGAGGEVDSSGVCSGLAIDSPQDQQVARPAVCCGTPQKGQNPAGASMSAKSEFPPLPRRPMSGQRRRSSPACTTRTHACHSRGPRPTSCIPQKAPRRGHSNCSLPR